MRFAGWTLVAEQDCDFAGIAITKGTTLHVHPGTTHGIVRIECLPPNYGAIAGLLCDGLLTQVDGPSPIVQSLLPQAPSLSLSSQRGAVRAAPASAWDRRRLALVR